MRNEGIAGVVRGRPVRTTIPGPETERPLDLVKRVFAADAPNRTVGGGHHLCEDSQRLRVRRVRDRRVLAPNCRLVRLPDPPDYLALKTLEHAIAERGADNELVHHSDRGVQYLSIRYTQRLADAGIQASVGSVGSSYDNALAETINGLFKTELIRREGPWRNAEDVELATLAWVHWFNHHRLLEPLGYVPPAEFESAFYEHQVAQEEAA